MSGLEARTLTVTIDGDEHELHIEEGMSGIGSRCFSIDGYSYGDGMVQQSADLEKGNHFFYKMKWRDTPWDYVYILIHQDHIDGLLDDSNAWRDPYKIRLPKKHVDSKNEKA